jgi:hypothetical protein
MIDFAAENRRGYWGFTDGHQFASNFEENEIDGIDGIVILMGLEEMGCKRIWKNELNS